MNLFKKKKKGTRILFMKDFRKERNFAVLSLAEESSYYEVSYS